MRTRTLYPGLGSKCDSTAPHQQLYVKIELNVQVERSPHNCAAFTYLLEITRLA